MLWILFFITIFLNGYLLHKLFISKFQGILVFINSFIIGSIFSVDLIYVLSCFTKNLGVSFIIYSIVSALFYLFNRDAMRMDKIIKLIFFFKKNKFEIGILLLFFIFSIYFFPKTFNYNPQKAEFLIASNVYLDFGAHLSFIRSFSLGNNFPFEVPFFANGGLIYHFMFDLYAGILEFLGLRIDLAFNIISIFSFSFLLFYTYKLSSTVFKNNRKVGLLTVIFFIFNSNLSYMTFLQKNGYNFSIFSSIWHNQFYLENSSNFFNGEFISSNFWNLNTFFNQRHLIFGLLFAVFIIYSLIVSQMNQKDKKPCVFLGIMLGLLPFWHTMIFLSIFLILLGFIIFEKSQRNNLLYLMLVAVLFALPQLFLIKIHSLNQILLKPGFLVSENLSILNFLKYWFINLGLSIITLIIGFKIANKNQKKLFIIFMMLFIVPNIVRFSSRNVFDDHKFFNLWIILINSFSALAVIYIYYKDLLGKIISVVLVICLTFAGLISLMVAKNDVQTVIQDYPNNNLLKWSLVNIPKNAIVLTNGEIYDPISLIGRKTIIGSSHYVYVYGGNPDNSLEEQTIILSGKNINEAKRILKKENISFIVLYKKGFAKNSKIYNEEFITNNFFKMYEDNSGTIFKI